MREYLKEGIKKIGVEIDDEKIDKLMELSLIHI